jgi:hypothetical protein
MQSDKIDEESLSQLDSVDVLSLMKGSDESDVKLTLNEAQFKALKNIQKFLHSDKNKFLLLGPGGSGKTTVITNAFNKILDCSEVLSTNSNSCSEIPIPKSIPCYKIAFCAFTNKATQVLKNIAKKFNVTFTADFLTIHKLLMLDIRYLDKETDIGFTFDVNKIDYLSNYDVIIFDECSTISKELYSYILKTQEYLYLKHGHKIKYIFIGDFWQLPPVGEIKSVIFECSTTEHWPISKLTKVMRSGNSQIYDLNQILLEWIQVFKLADEKKLKKFTTNYPYSLVPKVQDKFYISNQDDFYQEYISSWQDTPDIVILTYSKSNCAKANFTIQDRLDMNANREPPEHRESIKFYKGDRCCLDRPIEVYDIIRKEISKSVRIDEYSEYISLGNHLITNLYNGEIFDIISAEDVKIKTELNKLDCMKKYRYFKGQLLTVIRINDPDAIRYDILHIPNPDVDEARNIIRIKERRGFYISIMSQFIKKYPKLDYGYCITIYKSQGSEWKHVLVNLNSIKWSIVGKEKDCSLQKKKNLFKVTYTALSRASEKITLFWC